METIFDSACGTGGFLLEAYEYIKKSIVFKSQNGLAQDCLVQSLMVHAIVYMRQSQKTMAILLILI